VLVSRRERDVGGGWECVGRKWWMEEKAKDVTFEQNIKERVGPTSGRPAPHLRQARSARLMGTSKFTSGACFAAFLLTAGDRLCFIYLLRYC